MTLGDFLDQLARPLITIHLEKVYEQKLDIQPIVIHCAVVVAAAALLNYTEE